MPSIRPINTAILRRRFPEEYHRFFLDNEIVVSTASSFFWGGELSAFFGGISIIQKVPFRIYVGLKPISAKRIIIKKDFSTYFRPKNKFSLSSFESEEIKGINDYINDKLRIRIKNKGGCQITFLSEALAKEGRRPLGSFCGTISLILYLYYYAVTKKDVERWQGMRLNQLIKKDRWFNRIFNLAWKIATAARGFTSGSHVFADLINSAGLPIIYCTEKRSPLDDNKKLRNFFYIGERMADFIKNDPLIWSFDFGLIYSGTRISTASGIRSIEKMQQDLEEIKKDEFIKKLQLKKIPTLFARYSKEQSLWLVFMEMLDLISLQILLGLKNIFKYGSSEQDFVFLRDALNQHWDFFKILGLDTPNLDLLAQIVQERVNKDNSLGAGIKIAGVGRGGCLIFVVPKYSLVGKEEILREMIEERLGPDAYIGYLSWVDGIESGEVRIEQDLRKGIHSSFISHEEMAVTEYNHSLQTTSRLLTQEALEESIKKIDLVLDEINHRIYLRGKRLTSKEISSARETIRVLALLLQKKGKLNNIDLLSNSYSINRYDFAGKILLPLKRAVKKNLKKDLNLTVQGKIFSFSINFDPYNLRIWLINRRR